MRRRDLLAAALATGVVPAEAGTASPVVLELFTSQGCSSCPPADALLGQLVRRPQVIALAWHVDYWDHLGWRDRFASRAGTDRQRAYARQLGTDVFTPALIIDGARTLIGSQRAAIEAAIDAAAPLPVSVVLANAGNDITVDVGPAPGPVQVRRIVYDPVSETEVQAGENDGARLREYRIVRAVDTLAEWDGAARRIIAPPAARGQGVAILVQSTDLRVIGAADLKPV
jgi:hypothetical protein